MLFCQKEYPIIVLCKNRLRYLDVTLKSLSATVCSHCPIYVINDGSNNPNMIEYLTTNKQIFLPDDLFPHDTKWKDISGGISNLSFTTGVKGQVGVMLFKKSKYIRNFSYAVKLILEKHQCSHVIRVEGDIIFKQGWHRLFTKIINQSHPEVGIISGFRHIFDKPVLEDVSSAQKILRGTTGSQLYAISKKLCDKERSLIVNDSNLKEGADDFWFDGCRKASMDQWVTKTSMCQHIGFKSEVYKGRKELMISNHGVRAIDPDLHPPYAMNNKVTSFAVSNCEHFDEF